MSTAAPESVNVAGFNRRVAIGRRNAEEQLAPMERAYARLIRDAGREAAANLRALTASGDWQPPPESVLIAFEALAVIATRRLAPFRRRALKAVMTPPLARIGISFDLSHPLTADLLDRSGRRTGDALDAAVQPMLRDAVAEAYTQGLSVVDAADLVQAKIVDAAEWQARMLARTDLNSLSNGGSLAAAKMAGIGFKVWLTAADEKVRETHAAAMGQTVPVGQPFLVGGEELEYPGDPEASDGETINCRCVPIYQESAVAASAKEETMMHGTLKLGEATRAIDGDASSLLAATGPVGWISVTASSAGLAPAVPPAEWFHTPEAKQATPLTVTDDGQVYGHIAAWESCHTGKMGVCFTPPRSPSGYAYFNAGEVKCAGGKRVACGQVFFHAEHAPLTMTGYRAKDHYAHTGLAAADVRATDGRYGIWVAGALRPGLTVEEVREFMAAKPSGDWRQMTPGGALELVGVLAVNDPGFPVPRQIVASAEEADDGEMVALVATFDLPDDPAVERRLQVLSARAEGGLDGLAELAGV